MDFSFDDQQQDFRAQFRAMLDRECTPVDVRAVFASVLPGAPADQGGSTAETAKPDRRRWDHMASMGVVGLTVPESEGGLGLGMVDLVGLLEEAGWAGLPEPLAETTAMAVPLLADIAAADAGAGAGAEGVAAREWLQSIAAGETIATVVPEPSLSQATWADGADLLIVVSPQRVLAVRASDALLTPIGSIDATRRFASVSVPDGAGTTLAEGDFAHAHHARLQRRAAVASAAVLVGAADRLISFACDHAKAREQFGRPIGSFQAVKHLLATAYVRLEMARPAVYWAAASIDSDPESAITGRDCSMAKATASLAALESARVALQVHGAMGYTWEHDLHFWMKRVWVLASSWGDAASQLSATLDAVVATG